MSLLTENLTSVIPQLVEEQIIINKINTITQAPRQILQSIYFTWAKAFNDLHGDEQLRPSLLQKIGPAATELFSLNNALTTFMINALTGVRDDIVQDIQQRLNSLPEFVFHPDGTVTVADSTPSND
jgi:hypothetical protein